jgi:hypothetical protein
MVLQMVHYATPARGILGFTDRPRAMMAARGLEREARRPEGCHHGPRADRETQEPEGGDGVMT